LSVDAAFRSGDSGDGFNVGLPSNPIVASNGLEVGISSVIATGGATVGLEILPGDDDSGVGAAGAETVVVVFDALLGAAAETGVGAAANTGALGVAGTVGDTISETGAPVGTPLAASDGVARTPRFVHAMGIAEHWA
jgi:hypothetical protein